MSSEQKRYSFGGEPLPEMTSRVKALRGLIQQLIVAETELREAINRVPPYTAQWSNEDYYADEEAKCRLIATDLDKLLVTMIKDVVSRKDADDSYECHADRRY